MVNPRIKRQCCEGKVQAVAIHWWGIIFVLQHTDHLIHGRQLLVQGFHELLEVRDHLGGCIDQSLSEMCQASGKLEHAGEYIYIYICIYINIFAHPYVFCFIYGIYAWFTSHIPKLNQDTFCPSCSGVGFVSGLSSAPSSSTSLGPFGAVADTLSSEGPQSRMFRIYIVLF